MSTLRQLSAALLITGFSTLAFAQSTGAPRTPDTIGVEPADAREAMERARQREAEATVVPTDNTAAQRARDAAATTNRTTGSNLGTDGSMGARPARVDRN
jgi:hypothetical protein